MTSAVMAQSAPPLVIASPSVESTTKKPDADTGIKISGNLRFRPEVRDNADFKSSNRTQEFVGQRAWITLGKTFSDKSEVVVTIQDARVWGGQTYSDTAMDTSATTATGTVKYQEKGTDIREAYIDLKNFLFTPFTLQAGRQKFVYGDQRQLGHLDWTNVGRSFDGARLKWETDTNNLHLIGAVTRENDSDLNNVAVGKADGKDAYLSGIYNTFKGISFLHVDGYYLFYARPSGDTLFELHTLGFRVTNRTDKGKLPKGHSLDYTLEASYQLGYDNSPTKIQKVNAWAGALMAGYTFGNDIKFRVGAEVDAASGDTDSTDDKKGTYYTLFPLNHAFYGNADLMSWQNMLGYNLNFTTIFSPSLNLKLAYWLFQRMTDKDAHYGVAGRGATIMVANAANTDTLQFHEVDLILVWEARDYINVETGFSYLVRADGLKNAANAGTYDKDTSWGYLMTTIKF